MKLPPALGALVALCLVAAACSDSDATGTTNEAGGFLTSKNPLVELETGLPAGAAVKAIISSGDEVGGFRFEGLPDGIGIRPGVDEDTIDVYVSHEQSTVPNSGARDFENASVSKLTLSTTPGSEQTAVLSAEVAIPSSAGFRRFCSASMAGPSDGLPTYMFFTGEEANHIVDVPVGAPYEPDPSLGTERQGGYAVALNTDTGHFTQVAGMGRLNHENTIVVPGGWDGVALLTTDDTADGPGAQLYLYLAADQAEIFEDAGRLYALRISSRNGIAVDAADPFNGANDYLDLFVGDEFGGEFIPVPDEIADGTTDAQPQAGLEQWSNDNNVFQAIRLEDLAYDKNDPHVVYIADTGRTGVVPDEDSGRMRRIPEGDNGFADNGRIFQLVFNAEDPTIVDSLTVLADGDAAGTGAFVPFSNPDNVDTSTRSLMVQEDSDEARIWQHGFDDGSWRVVAKVTNEKSESSGIVDASPWLGDGRWLLDVQDHGKFVETDETTEPGIIIKRESGQLMVMTIPGS